MARKTSFKWSYTRNGKKHLTKKAKQYLSKVNKEKHFKSKTTKPIKDQQQRLSNIYRASLHYLYAGFKFGTYETEFRTQVYTISKYPDNVIKKQLYSYMVKEVNKLNNGLKAMFQKANLQGFENEEIGINDLGDASFNKKGINRISFDVEVRK